MPLKHDCLSLGKHTQDAELWKLAAKSFVGSNGVWKNLERVTISICNVVFGYISRALTIFSHRNT